MLKGLFSSWAFEEDLRTSAASKCVVDPPVECLSEQLLVWLLLMLICLLFHLPFYVVAYAPLFVDGSVPSWILTIPLLKTIYPNHERRRIQVLISELCQGELGHLTLLTAVPALAPLSVLTCSVTRPACEHDLLWQC